MRSGSHDERLDTVLAPRHDMDYDFYTLKTKTKCPPLQSQTRTRQKRHVAVITCTDTKQQVIEVNLSVGRKITFTRSASVAERLRGARFLFT